VLNYTIVEAEIDNVDTFFSGLRGHLSEKTEENTMTIAEYFMLRGEQRGIEQGIEQGMQQGKQQGIAMIVCRMHQNGFSFDAIEQATGLAVAEIQGFISRQQNSLDVISKKDVIHQ
jgi:predicted transposase/invertase (TIGR01784 family)